MARQLFFDETFLKENSEIDENVDMKLLNPTIWRCQIQYIQNVLGTKLYDAILTKIEASTLSGDYLTLVDDYCVDALQYWVMYEVQIPLLIKFRDKSVSKKNSTNSTPIDSKMLSRVDNRFKDKAEFFTKRISDYLCANESLFPEYNTEDEIDEVQPMAGMASTSLYMSPRTSKICRSRE
jgi:RNAse (barnase) inhibitor barstar